jgi:DNA-binding CsgD family transcriptional regulator
MKEVARILNVTPRTVAFHKYRMMKGLNLQNNADLIRFALREHIVPTKSSY